MDKDNIGTIVVVDDDEDILYTLKEGLRFRLPAFKVKTATNSKYAIELIELSKPDLVILDVMLPDRSGLEVCKTIRRSDKHIPIIFLSAQDAPKDRILGYAAGGNDYVTKPFVFDELTWKIKKTLEMTKPQTKPKPIISIADLEINEDALEVTRHGKVVRLSPTEFWLLDYLVRNKDKALSKGEIISHIWEGKVVEVPIVDSYISYLRKKIDGITYTDENGEEKKVEPLIQTVRSAGYMIRTPKEAKE